MYRIILISIALCLITFIVSEPTHILAGILIGYSLKTPNQRISYD